MTSTENAAWAAQVAAPACTAPTATPYTPPEPEPERADVNGPPRRALLLFTVGLVTAAAVVVGVARCGTDDPAPPPDDPAVSAPPAPAAPAVAVSEAAALPYTATDHCPPGSTGPQPLTGGGWWVCVRGSQGAELDGQIIHVTFPEPVVISSVQIVPGAAPTTPDTSAATTPSAPAAAESAGQPASATVSMTTNGPVPDTPENRKRFGGPNSNAGRRTAAKGN